MKRLFLVKGEERHEVERDSWNYKFKTSGGVISPIAAKHLGYTLEEVEERREFWTVAGLQGEFRVGEIAQREAKELGSEAIHWVEIHPNELVLSREDVEKAWDSDTVQSIVGTNPHECCTLFKRLCLALGFKESV